MFFQKAFFFYESDDNMNLEICMKRECKICSRKSRCFNEDNNYKSHSKSKKKKSNKKQASIKNTK